MDADPPTGPVALVTGATRGIGREVCRQLAARGYTVLLTGRSPDAVRRAAGDLRGAPGAGRDVRPLPMDVTDDAGVAAANKLSVDHGALVAITSRSMAPPST